MEPDRMRRLAALILLTILLVALVSYIMMAYRDFALYQVGFRTDGQYLRHLQDSLDKGHYRNVLTEYRYGIRIPHEAGFYRLVIAAALGQGNFSF